MIKKHIVRVLALVLALLMPIVTAFVTLASEEALIENSGTKYESPDINSLMGAGEEPEDLSVTAGATYQEKAWYEYVMYSEHAVSSYRVDDNTRILFYDPYTYTNAMVMDVEFDAAATTFDTMSEYTISFSTSKTMQSCVSATDTYTIATQTSGRDETESTVTNAGYTETTYNHGVETSTQGTVAEKTNYEYIMKATVSGTLTEKIGTNWQAGTSSYAGGSIDITASETVGGQWLTDEVTNTTEYSDGYKSTTTYSGESTLNDHTTSTTKGWTELSARVTKTLGSAQSTSSTWSETEGSTVTKKYAATHFASDGVTPLPWAIVHYQVVMPMKCCYQVKYEGEWLTLSTSYCLLTTVQGTCRAWMQNGQVYYEDWGSGEPVVATDFWAQFMTREQLINAYSSKLYPVGGND